MNRNEDMGYIIGVDLGGTNLRVALADEKKNIISIRKETLDKPDWIGATDQLINMIGHLVKESDISQIGVAAAGIIDLNRGTLKRQKLSKHSIDFMGPLKQAYDVPIIVVNDVNAAVLAERELGAGRGCDNLAYVTFSTGIGCGLIKDGKLIVEDEVNSLELGYMEVEFEGKYECPFAESNNWEKFCSGKNIPNFAKYLLENKYKDSMLAGSKLSTEEIFRYAKEGNVTALKILDEVGKINSFAFSKIIEQYGPEIISFGGSVALKNPELIMEPIQKYLEQSRVGVPKMLLTPLKEDVVILGALAILDYMK